MAYSNPYPGSLNDEGGGVGGGNHPMIDAAVLAVDPAFTSQYGSADAWKHKQTRAFLRNLGQGVRPVSIALLGDSTANATDEWFYLAMDELRASYAAHTWDYRLWDDTAQGWGVTTRLQTGTAGEAHLATDGATNRVFSCPDSTAVSITGDLSVRVKLQPTGSWTSAAGSDHALANKFGAGGDRSWRFYLRASDGKLVFEHSADGSTLLAKTSTVAVPFASGEAGWVRADLDVNNGAGGFDVLFYTSTDGSSWTQLGTTVTTATASSVFDSTATLDIGSRSGSEILLTGKLYACDLYSGIGANNTLVASWRAGDAYLTHTGGVLTGYDVTGKLWTGNSLARAQGITGAPTVNLLNASVSGQALSYFTDVTRFAKLTGARCRMVLASLSHNEGGSYYDGDSYRSVFSGLVDQIVAVQPDAAVVIVGQNPKASPSTADDIRVHRDRIRQLAELAATRDLGWIDAYDPLAADTATYVDPDGIHPTAAGSQLWADTALAFFTNA